MNDVKTLVNDFNVQVATVNGSGSQSANLVLMRAIFYMGVPVAGKNLFPSNIAGLPTWFTVRANKHGYVGRKKELDCMIAMNVQTVNDDLASLPPGALFIVNDAIAVTNPRADVTTVKVPFKAIVGQVTKEIKLHKLLVNMIYVGVLGQYVGLDFAAIEKAIDKQFKGKAKAAELNKTAVRAGMEWSKANPVEIPWRIEPMNATDGKIIIDGNAAAALGATFAGVTFVAWYPITPSSSLCESAIDYLGRYRHDAAGKATYAVVQAEDELASVGMVVGAGWAGARSMTSTAGPGMSLMAEFVGLAYWAEIPIVIWDIQRVGPSTGLPTRTAQCDVAFAAGLSHGDTKHILLFPATVTECYEFGFTSFDLAERFQTPVLVLSDLDLGMNNWMCDPFPYVERPLDRGKVLSKEDLTRLNGQFGRYKDVDGDGIPYRTIPGTDHPAAAYFTRGSGHDENANYSEKPQDYLKMMDRLAKKYETARKHVPTPIVDNKANAAIGLIAYGTTDASMGEARDRLAAQGIKTDYLRIRALPFTDHLNDFIANHDRVYVIEQNRDGQMFDLIKLHCGDIAHKTGSIRHYNGLPIDATSIVEGVLAGEKVEVA
jgi:2-oxoglutarate/2-oxoacid ferredoxin oxidoreductase subunit alpha